MSNRYKSYHLVISIDFGTAMSGYAMCFSSDDGPGKNIYCSKWDTDQYIKTPTALLLNKADKSFIAFGEEAHRKFSETEDEESVLFFERFKMSLFEPNATTGTERGFVKANNSDTKVRVELLVEHSLRFLSDRAITTIIESTGGNIQKDEVLWVITVPAVWDAPARETMVQLARAAGLTTEGLENVLICLEPEAASIDCLKAAQLSLEPKTKLMIIDAGGGTIDITCHVVKDDKSLAELCPSTGIPKGATDANKLYEEFLRDILSQQFDNNSINEKFHSPDFSKIKNYFETSKRIIKLTDTDKVTLDLSFLVQEYGQKVMGDLIKSYNEKNNLQLSLLRSNFRIPVQTAIKLFFEPIVLYLIQVVQEIFRKYSKQLGGLEYIFLVGGFATSSVLSESLKSTFMNQNKKIIIPMNPGYCVLKGAVEYGFAPTKIESRISSSTIGIEATEEFNENKHSPEHKIIVNGKEYCENVFDKFIKNGQPLDENTEVKRAYTPFAKGQTTIVLYLYKSSATEPDALKYVTDPRVQPCGYMSFEFPDPHKPNNERIIDVTMRFSANRIEAIPSYRGSPQHKINYETNFFLLESEAEEKIAELKKEMEIMKKKRIPTIVELVFCMDGTGSMTDWMAEVTKKLLEISEIFHQKYQDLTLRISVVVYRDINDEIPPHFETIDFTENVEAVRDFVSGLVAGGGGDIPEDVLGGLDKVCQLKWSENSIRVLVHLGDAPPHGTLFFKGEDWFKDGTGLSHVDVLTRLKELNIDYSFIKISFMTDDMIKEFEKVYNVGSKKMKIYDLVANVEGLAPSVISSVCTSVCPFLG